MKNNSTANTSASIGGGNGNNKDSSIVIENVKITNKTVSPHKVFKVVMSSSKVEESTFTSSIEESYNNEEKAQNK
jgi:hypothetical protein